MTSSFCIDVPETVLARAPRGDVAAFEHIYRLFERPAWNLALRLSGDAEDARGIVHDAMLRLFERSAQFRGESPFRGSVRQIVLNEALMRPRRERGTLVEDIDETIEPAIKGAPPWLWSDGDRLDAALNRLPDAMPSVIWICHVAEQPRDHAST